MIDYALDLKNFHAETTTDTSCRCSLCTQAMTESLAISFHEDDVADVILSNGSGLAGVILGA